METPNTSGTLLPVTPLAELNAAAASLVYHPLQDNEFRLVILLPGAGNDHLTCELGYAKVDDATQFEALSYNLRTLQNPAAITLNSEAFFVTRNLEAALFQLRSPSVYVLIWIDALAINQCDISERNRQVLNMP